MLVSLTGCLQLADLGPERRVGGPVLGGSGGEGGASAGGGGEGGAPGSEFSCAGGQVEWARHLGGAADDFSGKAEPDGEGGVFVSGTFGGLVDLGGGPLVSAGGADMFLARYDADGAHLWSKRFGDAVHQEAMQLGRAPDGGLVIAGSFQGEVDFGGALHVASFVDSVVARYDADGNHLWSHTYSGPNYQVIRALAVDPVSGDIYIGGLFHESLEIGGEQYTTLGVVDEADGFIAKLDIDGNVIWSRVLGGPTPDYVNGIAVRGDRVVAGGSAGGDIDLGAGVVNAALDGLADPWVAVYDTDGEPIWARVFTDPGDEAVGPVAFDPQGNIVAFGYLYGSLQLDSFVVTAPLGTYLAKLAPDGQVLAARVFGSMVRPNSLAVGEDAIVIGGWFYGTVDASPLVFSAVGDDDGLVMKLDGSLAPLWSVQLGSPAKDGVAGVALEADGSVLAFGGFRQSIAVPGCGSFQTNGGADLLLMRMAP